MNIGKIIKACRHRKNLSQKELAKKAKISISYLSLLERNLRKPNIKIIENIAAALDIPLSILIFLASDKKELIGLDKDIIGKLSHIILELIHDEKSMQINKNY